MRTVSQTYTVVAGGLDGTRLPRNNSHDSTAHEGNRHHTSLVDCVLFSEDSLSVLLYSPGDRWTSGKYYQIGVFFCYFLFDLIIYVPPTIFQL